MEAPEIAQFARNFAVMVRIQGPDPKALKMRRHAFHLHQSGTTTLSASGLLLPSGCLTDPPPIIEHIRILHLHLGPVVVTVASVVEPFLISQHRNSPTQELSPKMVADARIDVLVEGLKGRDGGGEHHTDPRWVPSQLLALVDVTASASAILSLVGAHKGLPEHHSWETGWSLSPVHNDPQSGMDVFQRQVDSDSKFLPEESTSLTFMAKLTTRIAFLGISTIDLKEALHIGISGTLKKGDFLLAVGSPFGVLSPLHFFNSVSTGAVANCFPQHSCSSSLLMADIRCLPGMEGSPVVDRQGCLSGLLTRPLRQKGSSAEIQLVITWDAIATTWNNELNKEAQRAQVELAYRSINSVQRASLSSSKVCRRSGVCLPGGSQLSFEKAISSVVLITVGDGVWASGIVLNNYGLILTNAHILETSRFGRNPILDLAEKTTALSIGHGRPLLQHGDNAEKKRELLFPSELGRLDVPVTYKPKSSLLDSHSNYKKISVRLDHVEPKVWCNAQVVYVSNGPLDVALLQLEPVQNQLCAITPESACPPKGSTVHVIGHGLIGPRSDVHPSISSGILSSVVEIPGPLHHDESSMLVPEKRYMPVMLQTTAAVHPGASGGAVVNSDGHMIGLVTSNAKHSGGTIIPHLNFSIPCSALEPVFKFSEKQDMSILRDLDKPNQLLSSIWALVPPPSPNMQSPPDKNYKDGRGSRFSNFLSEKNRGFTTLMDQKHLVQDKLPSKI